LHVSPKKITIMPDFIDNERLPSDRHISTPHNLIRIFASGRMIKDKGFDLLVDALALLPEETRRMITVTLSGDGPEREALMQQAARAQLSSIISFPGWVPKDEMFTSLAFAEIFVYPRFHHELSSVLLMEALALGVPSIVPDGGGLAWLADGGAMIFRDTPASLADAIETLVESPDMRMELREKALARAEEFNHHRMAPQLKRILARAADL
jgi:glycosyltransferase involved in cell wall biosynthesis